MSTMANNNVTNSSIFDVFPDHVQHDDGNITGGDASSAHEKFVPYNQKAIDLLIIGIILLSNVIAVACCVRTFFICKSRKQKRLVAPSPEGVEAAAIVNGETGGDGNVRSLTHETIHEATTGEEVDIEDGESAP